MDMGAAQFYGKAVPLNAVQVTQVKCIYLFALKIFKYLKILNLMCCSKSLICVLLLPMINRFI